MEVPEGLGNTETHNESNLFYIWAKWHIRQSAMVHCVFSRRRQNHNDQAEAGKRSRPAGQQKSIAVQWAGNTQWT